MNSLIEMRALFESLGKPVTEYQFYTFVADGYTWGLVHDDPVRDGVVMAPVDWKAYVKALKAGAPAPVLKQPEIESKMADVARSLGIGSNLPLSPRPRLDAQQVICPHCNKSGALQGMKIHHFDRCKQKPTKASASE